MSTTGPSLHYSHSLPRAAKKTGWKTNKGVEGRGGQNYEVCCLFLTVFNIELLLFQPKSCSGKVIMMQDSNKDQNAVKGLVKLFETQALNQVLDINYHTITC